MNATPATLREVATLCEPFTRSLVDGMPFMLEANGDLDHNIAEIEILREMLFGDDPQIGKRGWSPEVIAPRFFQYLAREDAANRLAEVWASVAPSLVRLAHAFQKLRDGYDMINVGNVDPGIAVLNAALSEMTRAMDGDNHAAGGVAAIGLCCLATGKSYFGEAPLVRAWNRVVRSVFNFLHS